MSAIHTALALTAKFQARFAQSGVVDLSAAADKKVAFPTEGQISTVQAAGVRSFSAPGKQVWVKVTEHFLVLGETVKVGEFVELPEDDVKRLILRGFVEIANPADLAAAQKAGK